MTKKLESEREELPLPPCTVVLHSPWMNKDPNNHYVGSPTDPRLIQCSYANEIAGDTPPIIDSFLSLTQVEETYWSEAIAADGSRSNVIGTESPGRHSHYLEHGHYGEFTGGVEGINQVDDNDSGNPRPVQSAHHRHLFNLDEVRQEATEEASWQVFLPLHYELGAYYVERGDGSGANIPAGTVALSHVDDGGEFRDWQRLDREALKRDPRETDSFYSPRRWDHEVVRVVGCTPSKHRKGTEKHTHFLEPHNHSGSTEEATSYVGVDQSSGSTDAHSVPHSHAVSRVSVSREVLSQADNLRRHRPVFICMAKVDNPQLHKGMMFPFIPETGADIQAVKDRGDWRFYTEETVTEEDPVFLSALKVGSNVNYNEEARRKALLGENEHSHSLAHSHRVDFAQPNSNTGPRSLDGDNDDDDPFVASLNHAHYSVSVSGIADSSPVVNPLPFRRCLFIEFQA